MTCEFTPRGHKGAPLTYDGFRDFLIKNPNYWADVADKHAPAVNKMYNLSDADVEKARARAFGIKTETQAKEDLTGQKPVAPVPAEEAPKVELSIEEQKVAIEKEREKALLNLLPKKKVPEGPFDFVAAITGGIPEFYQQMFDMVKQGKDTIGGIKEKYAPLLQKLYNEGKLKDKKDVWLAINPEANKINAEFDAKIAALKEAPKTEAPIVGETKPNVLETERQGKRKTRSKIDAAKLFEQAVKRQAILGEGAIGKAVELVSKALKVIGVKVSVLSTDDFEEAARKYSEKHGLDYFIGSDGYFLSGNNEIIINKDTVSQYKTPETVVFHEGTHPIINMISNFNPKLYKALIKGLKQELKNNKELKGAAKFAEAYSKQGEGVVNDEFLVEVIARLASGEISLMPFEPGVRGLMIEFLNKIAKAIGLPQIKTDTSRADFQRIATGISEALKGEGNLDAILKETYKEELAFEERYAQRQATDKMPSSIAGAALASAPVSTSKPAPRAPISIIKELENLSDKEAAELYNKANALEREESEKAELNSSEKDESLQTEELKKLGIIPLAVSKLKNLFRGSSYEKESYNDNSLLLNSIEEGTPKTGYSPYWMPKKGGIGFGIGKEEQGNWPGIGRFFGISSSTAEQYPMLTAADIKKGQKPFLHKFSFKRTPIIISKQDALKISDYKFKTIEEFKETTEKFKELGIDGVYDQYELFLFDPSNILNSAETRQTKRTIEDVSIVPRNYIESAYNKAVQDGSNPKFVEAVNKALGIKESAQASKGEREKALSVKDIDVNNIRTLSRPGKRVSKGLSVATENKKKVVQEAEDLSLDYVEKNAPKIFVSNANIISKFPIVSGIQNFKQVETVEDAKKVYDVFVRQVADNLKYLMDKFNPDFKDISTLWYDGANILAQNFSKQYGVSEEQAAGMIASMSPQKDWYQNVRLAEMVMMAFKENPVMSNEMVKKQVLINTAGLATVKKNLRKANQAYDESVAALALESTPANKKAVREAKAEVVSSKKEMQEKIVSGAKIIVHLNGLVGKSMNSVPANMRGYYARLWNEINTTKDYNVLRPDGVVIDVAYKKDGQKAKVAWGSYTEINKAVSIYIDGSQENITKTLGEMHKIRNFFNNIIDPMSKDGDVTMDTHAIAAALLLPLSGKSKQVEQNFGTGTSNSSPLGIKGLYYAYAEAYSLAAKEAGLLPRQVQSITWEAVRGLFTDVFKRNPAEVNKINNIWKKYSNGEISINEARNEIIAEAGGINDPTWSGPIQGGTGVDTEKGSVGGGVAGDGRVPVGGAAGGGRRRSGGGTAQASSGERERAVVGAGNRLFNKRLEAVETIADGYFQRVFGTERPKFYGTRVLDTDRAKRISKAYADMKHDPTNPKVKASYDAMVKETLDQYKDVLEGGYAIEINNNEPYNNSEDMIEDLRKNKRIKIFSTESGFGDTQITDKQRADNPMLRDSGYKDINGIPLLNNDVFRAVHDFFGHAELGNSFGAKGEENAWNVHARMYSPLAKKAVTAETRGQNSFVNFSGINAEIDAMREEARKLRDAGNETAAQKIVDEIYEKGKFAEQKVGLLPDEFVEIDDTFEGDPDLVAQRKGGMQASMGGREKIQWQESIEGKGDPSISARSPIVQEAAKNLKEGKISNEEYRAIASENSPIGPITKFFAPATLDRIVQAISSDKVDKVNIPIENNTTVGLRLDIPAYKKNNTWVVSVHEGDTNAGKALSYTNVARIKDVNFGVEPKGALGIAAGTPKATIGRMFGQWENIEGNSLEEKGENAKKLVENIANNPDWVQVGMNPFRHSYFYDRSSENIGRPIKSAEEVIQVGGLVYAKKPVYGQWTDEAYRVKGLLDVNQKPIQFSMGVREPALPLNVRDQIIDARKNLPLDEALKAAEKILKNYGKLSEDEMNLVLDKFEERYEAKTEAEYFSDHVESLKIANKLNANEARNLLKHFRNFLNSEEDLQDAIDFVDKLAKDKTLLDTLNKAKDAFKKMKSIANSKKLSTADKLLVGNIAIPKFYLLDESTLIKLREMALDFYNSRVNQAKSIYTASEIDAAFNEASTVKPAVPRKVGVRKVRKATHAMLSFQVSEAMKDYASSHPLAAALSKIDISVLDRDTLSRALNAIKVFDETGVMFDLGNILETAKAFNAAKLLKGSNVIAKMQRLAAGGISTRLQSVMANADEIRAALFGGWDRNAARVTSNTARQRLDIDKEFDRLKIGMPERFLLGVYGFFAEQSKGQSTQRKATVLASQMNYLNDVINKAKGFSSDGQKMATYIHYYKGNVDALQKMGIIKNVNGTWVANENIDFEANVPDNVRKAWEYSQNILNQKHDEYVKAMQEYHGKTFDDIVNYWPRSFNSKESKSSDFDNVPTELPPMGNIDRNINTQATEIAGRNKGRSDMAATGGFYILDGYETLMNGLWDINATAELSKDYAYSNAMINKQSMLPDSSTNENLKQYMISSISGILRDPLLFLDARNNWEKAGALVMNAATSTVLNNFTQLIKQSTAVVQGFITNPDASMQALKIMIKSQKDPELAAAINEFFNNTSEPFTSQLAHIEMESAYSGQPNKYAKSVTEALSYINPQSLTTANRFAQRVLLLSGYLGHKNSVDIISDAKKGFDPVALAAAENNAEAANSTANRHFLPMDLKNAKTFKKFMYFLSTYTFVATNQFFNNIRVARSPGYTAYQKKVAWLQIGGFVAQQIAFQIVSKALSEGVKAVARKVGWADEEDEEKKSQRMMDYLYKAPAQMIADIATGWMPSILSSSIKIAGNDVTEWLYSKYADDKKDKLNVLYTKTEDWPGAWGIIVPVIQNITAAAETKDEEYIMWNIAQGMAMAAHLGDAYYIIKLKTQAMKNIISVAGKDDALKQYYKNSPSDFKDWMNIARKEGIPDNVISKMAWREGNTGFVVPEKEINNFYKAYKESYAYELQSAKEDNELEDHKLSLEKLEAKASRAAALEAQYEIENPITVNIPD